MNIFHKVKIHPLFFLMCFLIAITGNFKPFFLFSSIIVIHELGHIIGSLFYHWKIDKVIVLPFGGLTVFNEKIDKPFNEELIVTLLGPLFQIAYYLLFKNYLDLYEIHYGLLLFNLLPIIPLDGSKIMDIILNNLLPFRISNGINILISFFICLMIIILLLFNGLNIILIMTILLLIIKLITFNKKSVYIFNKFLLEKYQDNIKYKKKRKIRGININKMYRQSNHLFYNNEKICSEKEILTKKFDLFK